MAQSNRPSDIPMNLTETLDKMTSQMVNLNLQMVNLNLQMREMKSQMNQMNRQFQDQLAQLENRMTVRLLNSTQINQQDYETNSGGGKFEPQDSKSKNKMEEWKLLGWFFEFLHFLCQIQWIDDPVEKLD